MPIRRRNYSRAHLWSQASRSGAVVGAAIGTVVVLLASAVYFGLQWSTSQDDYNDQVIVVESLQLKTPDERMRIANDILHLQNGGISLSSLSNKDFYMMVEYVSQNGSDPWTTMSPLGWSTYFLDWVPSIMQAAIVLIGLAYTRSYIRHCRRSKYYLADLPWRKPWLWASVLVLPLLWIPLAVSAVRMHRHPPRPPRSTQEKCVPEAPPFTSNEQDAKIVYAHMRTKGTRDGHALLVKRIDEELQATQAMCAELANELQGAQRERLKLKAQSARLHELDDEPVPLPASETLEQEFNRIIQLPGVLGIRPEGKEGIAIQVAASVEYGIHRYNLGTWEIRLYLDGEIESTELESGVLPKWGRKAPAYRYGDGFCFGDFEKPISGHLESGQILEAVLLAIQAVNNINSEDRPKIPEAFRCIGRVDKEEAA